MALLATQNLTAHYGDFQALFGVDIALNEGETIAIIGATGAGKTTPDIATTDDDGELRAGLGPGNNLRGNALHDLSIVAKAVGTGQCLTGKFQEVAWRLVCHRQNPLLVGRMCAFR